MKIRNLMVSSAAFLAVACLLTSISSASILYSAPPNGAAGFGWNSNSGTQQIVQNFSLGSAGTVNTISFFGFHQSSTPSIGSSFVLEFFADVAGAPSTTSFYSHTTGVTAGVDTGIDNSVGRDIFRWDFAVPGAALSAATQYWFGVKSNSGQTWTWSHSSSDGSGNVWARFDNTSAFQQFGSVGTQDNQAMEFAGSTIPEPGALMIWSVFAGAGLVLNRRRRKVA